MSEFIDEDGNDVEVSFQMQAELFADEVLESLAAQRSVLDREAEYLTNQITKLEELLALVDEKNEYRKAQLAEQVRWAEDSLSYLDDRRSEIAHSKMSTEIALDEIVKEPEGWMLAPGEHEEWIAHHRAVISKAIGNPRW